jgi:hypothetical protein
MFRRVVHFAVLCIAKYWYGEKIFHLNGRFFPFTGNPTSAYKQLSSHSSRTGENRRARPKKFVYIRVANLGDFSPNKAHFGGSFEKPSGHLLDQYLLKRFFLKILLAALLYFTVPVHCNAKYPKLHESANRKLFKF